MWFVDENVFSSTILISFRADRGLIRSTCVMCVCLRVCVPEVSGISKGTVAGDAFTLPLVEGVQRVRVIAGFPAAGVQITPFVETVQHVLPLCI